MRVATERRGLRAYRHALSRGALLRPLGNVVVVMPPLSIRQEELCRITQAVERGIAVATAD